MARIVEEELPDMPGQDAFLDVLTNMVGIIILLVVVMGIRSSRAASAELAAENPASAAVSTEEQLNKTYRDAVRAQQDFGRVVNQVFDVRRENLLRASERDQLITFVAAFGQELKDRRATLSTEQQRDFDLRRQLAEAQSKLENLSREQVALVGQPVEAEVLENRPTPIVRSRLDKELFLQLSQNHVAVVPLADLYEEVRAEVSESQRRFRDENRITGSVGPIGNYRMRYVVSRQKVEVRSSSGEIQSGSRIQLVRAELVPLATPLGEAIDQAILPNSDLFAQLKDFSPLSTTISIAVYPDSLRALHALKRQLHDAGYGVAEMLMADGELITFSPHGQSRYAQ